MKRRILAAAIITGLGLTGCSSTTTAKTTDAPTHSAALATTATTTPTAQQATTAAVQASADYQLVTMQNATITFTLPASVTDPKLTAIEAYRKAAGAAPVSYVIASVDNKDGLDSVNMYNITAIDGDGNKYEFFRADQALSDWSPTLTTEGVYELPDGKKLNETEGDALYRTGIDLYNANNDSVEIGEKATLILYSKSAKLPSTFTRVTGQPNGAGEPQQAVATSALGKD